MWVRFDDQGQAAWFGPAQVAGAEWVDGVDVDTLLTCRRTPAGDWVLRDPVPVEAYEPTVEEIAEAERLAERAAEGARKLAGIEFEGVMCSATGQDQAGLLAVLTAIRLQGAEFRPTQFEFENGSTLVISLNNFQAFMATWVPFRQSFYLAA